MNKLNELSNVNIEKTLENLEVNELVELKNDVSEIFKYNKLISNYINKVDMSSSENVEKLRGYVSQLYENPDKYMSLLKVVASKDEMEALNNLITNKLSKYQKELNEKNLSKISDESNENYLEETITVNGKDKESLSSKSSEMLALNTTPIKEVSYSTFSNFIFIFGLFTLLVSVLLMIRNVKKSRTK